MRVFEGRRIWHLEPEIFEDGMRLLAREIGTKWTIGAVVGIARGGREPAALLARLMNVPLHEIRARHNLSDDVWSKTAATVEVDVSSIGPLGQEARTLVVDDICGSGGTLQAVYGKFAELGIEQIASVTLCRNAGSDPTPDMWLWTVQDWVVFPWESFPDGRLTEALPRARKACTA